MSGSKSSLTGHGKDGRVQQSVAAGPDSRLTVLVVEDEALIALNLAAVAEDLGLAVVGLAATAESAFALAAGEPPHVAIVDVNLVDGQTGPQIAATLADRHGTRIVFATGNPDGLAPGGPVVAVLKKPYADEAIAAALRRAIEVVRASSRAVDRALITSGSEIASGGL